MKQLLQRWLSPVSEPGYRDRRVVDQIFDVAKHLRSSSTTGLCEQFEQMRTEVAAGRPWFEPPILSSTLGIVMEGMRRTLSVDPYDVQVLAGVVLSRNTIAEMQTGEGKTLTCAFPAMLFSLAGRGVHVMTVNAYLAERDYEKLLPLYDLLGVRLGILRLDQSEAERRNAYDADVTYGPGYEFGFDYLRDHSTTLRSHATQHANITTGRGITPDLKTRSTRQRGTAFAIVDEADSVLIDEADTPLVISTQSYAPHAHPEPYQIARDWAKDLRPGADFQIDARTGIHLTAQTRQRLTENCEATALNVILHRPWTQYIEKALTAQYLFRRDVDYVVGEDRIQLVDQNTGRIHADRTWQDGLHQAVEANEGLTISQEQESVARISRQRYFRLYAHRCGLTGTAASAARELSSIYELSVVTIPLRTPSRRAALPTRYFATEPQKWNAIVDDVRTRHARGQPVLLGTRTITQSDALAKRFSEVGLPFQLLNGRQSAEEAAVVAQAGQLKAITIATNLAGRGTDIRLGSNVAELGGLHVVATERHESERVDRQLIGRCARQGDPGSFQFFVSAEDQLITVFSRVLVKQMRRLAGEDGEIHVDLSAQVRAVQSIAEREARRRRLSVAEYDEWRMDLISRLS